MFLLFALSFSIVSATISGKTARDTFFLNQFDMSYLPLMFVATAVAVGLIVPLYSRLLEKKGPYNTILITGIIAAVSLGLIQLFFTYWMIPVLYVWMEVIATVLSFQIWTIAGDLFDSRQAKRLYGILAAGGSISFIFIGLWLQPFIAQFGSGSILLVTIIFITLAMGLSLSIRKLPSHVGTKSDSVLKTTKDKEPMFTPYLKSVALMTVMIGIAATIVDFQFKFTAGSSITNADELARFFGKFYALAGVASLGIQLFITGRLLATFGVLAGLLILPFAMIAGFSMFLVYPVLLSAFVGKFAEQTFVFTIHQPTIQLLWLPVKKWRKQFGKPFIDGTLRTTVDGLTGFLTFFIIKIASFAVLTVVAIIASVFWVVSAFYIRKGYIQTLNEALEARRLNFEDLQIDTLNHAMVNTIDKSLKQGDVYEQLFILELIQPVSPEPWKETLESLMVSATNPVRRSVLQFAEPVLDDQLILDLINEPFLEAIPVSGSRKIVNAIPTLTELLSHKDFEIRIAAAGSLILIGEGSQSDAIALIRDAIESADTRKIILGIKYSYNHPDVISQDQVFTFLQHDLSAIRKAAIELASIFPDEKYLPFLIGNLGSPKTGLIARTALLKYDRQRILESIQRLIENPPLTAVLKRGIISTLETIPTVRSQQILLTYFDPTALSIYEQAVNSLLTIAKTNPLTKATQNHIRTSIRFLAKRVYSLYQLAHLIKSKPHSTLLRDYIRHETQTAIPILIKLGAINSPDVPVSQCIKSLRSGDPNQFSYGLELLETIFSREEREIVTPLIEGKALAERVQIGHRLFKTISYNLNTYLENNLYSSSTWLSAITLDFLIQTKTDLKKTIQWDKVKLSHIHGEILQRATLKDFSWIGTLPDEIRKFRPINAMYTTLEKTILLKSVSLFKSIPAEIVSTIAQIAEEIPVTKDTILFKEGEIGDAMYVIVDGKIAVHKGEKQIATLTKWDCLGEMALLDEEPRSADATASSDSILLRISQESFAELLHQHPNIMHSLLKILTGRLRNSI